MRNNHLKYYRVAVFPGHYPSAPGAVNMTVNPPIIEYYICKKTADIIAKTLQNSIIISPQYEAFQVYSLTGTPKQKVNESAFFKAHLSIDLHLNSHENPNANGSEVLYSGKSQELPFAELMLSEILNSFKLRNRGVKNSQFWHDPDGSGPRPAELRGTNYFIDNLENAYIPEPLFISNPVEAAIVNSANFAELYAGAVIRAIRSHIKATDGIQEA